MTVPSTAGTTTEDTSIAGNMGQGVTMTQNVITRDLGDDHPVGVEYSESRFRATTHTYYQTYPGAPATAVDLKGDGNHTFAYVTQFDPDQDGTLQKVVTCYSCHDPHLDLDGIDGDEDSFLRVKPQQAWDQNPNIVPSDVGQTAENLCIQCHLK
jgi:hypothetical protein